MFRSQLEIELINRIFKVVWGEMGINHCGLNITMAQEVTYCDQWHACHYKVTCVPYKRGFFKVVGVVNDGFSTLPYRRGSLEQYKGGSGPDLVSVGFLLL